MVVARVVLFVVCAMISAACYTKVENGQVWACDDIQTSRGTIPVCQPTGLQR